MSDDEQQRPHDINKTIQSIIIGSNSLIARYQAIRDLGIGVLFTFYNCQVSAVLAETV